MRRWPVSEASGFISQLPAEVSSIKGLSGVPYPWRYNHTSLTAVSTDVLALEHTRPYRMGDNVAGDAAGSSRNSKTCFVTVGATAPFDGLIKAILQPKFLKALHDANYTELKIQHGYDGDDNLFSRLNKQADVSEFCKSSNLKVTGFGFDKDGLDKHMRDAKGSAPHGSSKDATSEGAVMSHAG